MHLAMNSLAKWISFSHIRNGLVCLSIAANALCAGGVFTFPLISPALVTHMKLTQPQLTTIAVAGMVGQYPLAPFVGKLLDRSGPRMCSFLAAVLFSLGFGLFSLEIAHTPDEISQPSTSSFRRLTVYFALASFGTVLSYFSSVFSATRTFPHYMSVASGTSMALFGFSPLVLSAIANALFTTPESGLDVTHFLAFLAVVSGVVHLFGTLAMPGQEPLTSLTHRHADEEIGPSTSSDTSPTEFVDDENVGAEEEPLLVRRNKPKGTNTDIAVHVVPVPEPQHGSVKDLLKDSNFWLLVVVILILVGAAEMVMANLGSIYMSLPSSSGASPDVSTAVQLLSASNTFTRLAVGPVADYVSPVASYIHTGVWSFPRKHHVSRIVFLLGACVLLAITFAWLEVGIRTREAIWSLSLGVGVVYGTTFTVLPGILSSIWGLPNLGRNFGIISYAPFVGTTVFSYLYAFVADHYTSPGEDACSGVACWKLTFWLSAGFAITAVGISGFLWKRWRGRV
ncbi:MFS general substrate transporter [Panus rudis PR-1116 ss-1]|nr:MFS general substrate transporter [Panus rudis PR-1116 ss-1]